MSIPKLRAHVWVMVGWFGCAIGFIIPAFIAAGFWAALAVLLVFTLPSVFLVRSFRRYKGSSRTYGWREYLHDVAEDAPWDW